MSKKSSELSPRLLAVSVLRQQRQRNAFVSPLIASLIDQSPLSAQDKGLSASLVRGVITYEGVLDSILDDILAKPGRLDPVVRDCLRLGAYELLVRQTPPFAAVNEAVTLTRRLRPHAKGLVNAVLRSVASVASEFPFGNPEKDDEAAARLCAMPLWLFEKIAQERGRDFALGYGLASVAPAPIHGALLTDRARSLLTTQGIELMPLFCDGKPINNGYSLSSALPLKTEPCASLVRRGEIIIADGASQWMAQWALPQDFCSSFLEIGAGRGTKTLLLLHAMQKQWGCLPKIYDALDNQKKKLAIAQERCEAAGYNSVNFRQGDGRLLSEALESPGTYEGVFIDGPCSGLGTLRRHPEIRWRVSEELIVEKATLGLNILKSAAACVSTGGELFYATCSISLAENEGVCEKFLASPTGEPFELMTQDGNWMISTLDDHTLDAHRGFRLRRSR